MRRLQLSLLRLLLFWLALLSPLGAALWPMAARGQDVQPAEFKTRLLAAQDLRKQIALLPGCLQSEIDTLIQQTDGLQLQLGASSAKAQALAAEQSKAESTLDQHEKQLADLQAANARLQAEQQAIMHPPWWAPPPDMGGSALIGVMRMLEQNRRELQAKQSLRDEEARQVRDSAGQVYRVQQEVLETRNKIALNQAAIASQKHALEGLHDESGRFNLAQDELVHAIGEAGAIDPADPSAAGARQMQRVSRRLEAASAESRLQAQAAASALPEERRAQCLPAP